MKCTLIHSMSIGGHQLEYLHHLYIGAIKRPTEKFVFLVPPKFHEDSEALNWPTADNIIIVTAGTEETPSSNCSLLKKGLINSLTIRRYVKRYQVTDVIVITMMEYMPYLPLLVRNVRFSGIVYRIYLYEWKEESIKHRIEDAFKYWIMSRCKVFHHVYMCNDSTSANCLNRLFKTNKYLMMPDPVASLSNYQGKNLREELKIESSKIILLHPGGMSEYKNTLGILKAINMLDKESCQRLVFIFAGSVNDSIKEEFFKLYKEACLKVKIFLFEGFMSFERLADLFVTCDYVLIPYTVKGQSSGIVGHAAFYGKPVIVMEGGVIGKMVRKWRLGELISRSSDNSLYQFLFDLKNKPIYNTDGNGYAESHTVEMFNQTILGEIDI